VLGLTGAGCGDARNADEGDFDRWDACERMVSLCGDTRDDLARCVSQIEENYPDPSERTEIVRCMQEAPTCQDMIENCNLGLDPAEEVPGRLVTRGFAD